MGALLQDARLALRSLARNPGFAAVAIVTLGLGIGVNTAIFSVVNAVLLRPLAYARPDQLVALPASLANVPGRNLQASMPEYQDLRREVPALADVAAAWPININLTGAGEPERIQAAVVSANYFPLLGVAPVLGRAFVPADAGGRIGYVAMISYGLWQRRFGGDRRVIGQTVRLDADPMTIIGVLPRGFRHPAENSASPVELWAPIDLDAPDPEFINNRRMHVFDLVGRLRPGQDVEVARRQVDALVRQTRARFPDIYPAATDWRLQVVPLAERVTGNVRPALLVLLGAVGFVLLIACANVANLLLARATVRGREIAIRSALGGSRARVVRLLLTESLVLAAVGGVLGLLFAVWGTDALSHVAERYLPRVGDVGLDPMVLAFTAALVILTGVGFGLLPAWQASRPALQGALQDASRGATAGGRAGTTRAVLVVAELAIALVLLAGAGLLLRSFQRLLAVDLGFDPERVLTMQLWLPWPNEPEKGTYFSHEARVRFYDRTLEELGRLPGVQAAGLVSRLPLRGTTDNAFLIEGRPTPAGEPPHTAEIRVASRSYFQVMRIPLLAGRWFDQVEDNQSSGGVLINHALATKYWAGESPLGRRIRLPGAGPQAAWLPIVGVVGDVRQAALDAPAREEIYFSFHRLSGQEMSLALRTAGDPDRLAGAAVRAIHGVDPELPPFNIKPMRQVVAEATGERRFSMLLLVLFAALALALAGVGVYGVMAYATAQRAHEMGIRLALGASPRAVLALVLGDGMRLVLVGVLLGALGAAALGRLLGSQLYEVSPWDPLTIAGVGLLLAGVAFAATYLPARRVTRIDPMRTLRAE